MELRKVIVVWRIFSRFSQDVQEDPPINNEFENSELYETTEYKSEIMIRKKTVANVYPSSLSHSLIILKLNSFLFVLLEDQQMPQQW